MALACRARRRGNGTAEDLYAGETVGQDRGRPRLAVPAGDGEPELVAPDVRGRPVYLGMAQNAERDLRMKPQNILVNLPLVEAS